VRPCKLCGGSIRAQPGSVSDVAQLCGPCLGGWAIGFVRERETGMRATDKQKDACVELLNQAYAQGQLTANEVTERRNRAYRVGITEDELARLLRDVTKHGSEIIVRVPEPPKQPTKMTSIHVARKAALAMLGVAASLAAVVTTVALFSGEQYAPIAPAIFIAGLIGVSWSAVMLIKLLGRER